MHRPQHHSDTSVLYTVMYVRPCPLYCDVCMSMLGCQQIPRSTPVCADLINLATRLIALVQAFDEVAADQEALDLASEKFQDLLKVPVWLAYGLGTMLGAMQQTRPLQCWTTLIYALPCTHVPCSHMFTDADALPANLAATMRCIHFIAKFITWVTRCCKHRTHVSISVCYCIRCISV